MRLMLESRLLQKQWDQWMPPVSSDWDDEDDDDDDYEDDEELDE